MKVSIVIIFRNEARYIKNCLESLFKQNYREFEIILIDNGSTDGGGEIVTSLKDNRIRYFYEPSRCGIAELRNLGVKRAAGEYIFFTDGDCMPNIHWLEEGLKVLEGGKYVGVEGKTYYEMQEVTISDYATCQFSAGLFMTCNMAYRRDILVKVNYFDAAFRYGHEDRDLAFRIMRFGKIYFSTDMLVAHQKKRLSIKALFNKARQAEDMVYFIKKHGRHTKMYKNILYPQKLLAILCPPLVILTYSYRSCYDLILGFFKYISFIYERALIWKAAITKGVFVI